MTPTDKPALKTELNMCWLWQESKQWHDYCEVPSLLMNSAAQLQAAATEPMTCHLFNNIYSAEICNSCHIAVSFWRALSSSVRLQPFWQECACRQQKNNHFKGTQLETDHLFMQEDRIIVVFRIEKKKKLDVIFLMFVWDMLQCVLFQR